MKNQRNSCNRILFLCTKFNRLSNFLSEFLFDSCDFAAQNV